MLLRTHCNSVLKGQAHISAASLGWMASESYPGRVCWTGRQEKEERMSEKRPARVVPGYIDHKDDHVRRLRRIEGQVRGLQKMVESDTYCIDILTQVTAATKALEAVALGLLDDHLRHCISHAAGASADLDHQIDEASAAIARLVRS